MEVFVDGNLKGPSSWIWTMEVKAKAPAPLALEGTTLSLEEAAGRSQWSPQLLNGLAGLAGLMLIVTLVVEAFVASDAAPVNRLLAVSLPVASGSLALFVLSEWLKTRKLDVHGAGRASAAAPPGQQVRLDEQGLSVGDLTADWAQVTVKRLDLNYDSGGDSDTPCLRVERVALVAGDKQVSLDRDLLSNGEEIVDAIYARLVATRGGDAIDGSHSAR